VQCGAVDRVSESKCVTLFVSAVLDVVAVDTRRHALVVESCPLREDSGAPLPPVKGFAPSVDDEDTLEWM
jgi:hypothetical protein